MPRPRQNFPIETGEVQATEQVPYDDIYDEACRLAGRTILGGQRDMDLKVLKAAVANVRERHRQKTAFRNVLKDLWEKTE